MFWWKGKLGREGTEAREVSSAAEEQLTSSVLFCLIMPCWEGEATVGTQFSLFHFTNEDVRYREAKSRNHKALKIPTEICGNWILMNTLKYLGSITC